MTTTTATAPAVRTNIKNLPEGEYFTEVGYSQTYPWKVIKRTAKTITLARVLVQPDGEWKPEISPGGFAGHCSNQQSQTWAFASVDMDWTTTIRQNKKGQWVHAGTRFRENEAREFYDFNY